MLFDLLFTMLSNPPIWQKCMSKPRLDDRNSVAGKNKNGALLCALLHKQLQSWQRAPVLFGCRLGAAARNIHCYTVITFWWGAVGLIVRIETLLAIARHRIFIMILVEYRLGLLGIEMYHGFKRPLNPTDSSPLHIFNDMPMPDVRDVHGDCKTIYCLKTLPAEWLTWHKCHY